jgi:hypothetical protein
MGYNDAMSKSIQRLGVFPSLLLGSGLFVIGVLSMSHIVDNWWPFDVARLDLVRSTALDRADAAMILEAANTEILLAFLATVMVATTGLVLPLSYILNRRFSKTSGAEEEQRPTPPFLVTLRQSMWVGVWVAFCVWLQMNRALSFAVAGLVAAVLVLFELLLHVRTRAASVTAGAQEAHG